MSRSASRRWAIEEDLKDLSDLDDDEVVTATTQEHGDIIANRTIEERGTE